MGACLIGCGKAMPGLKVENADLEKLVQTSDEWISSRTGISSRRIAVKETMLDLALAACREALGSPFQPDGAVSIDSSGASMKAIEAASIDLVVLTTVSPDMIVPCNAAALKKFLGLDNAIAFDMNAACTGFIYGATVAESMMAASQPAIPGAAGRNPIRRALVVSAERLTHITDWQDRNTCVLFGDGAGAAVFEWDENAPGIMASFIKNDDDDTNALTCKQSYSSDFPFDENGVVCDQEAKAAHDAAHPDVKSVDYGYIASLGLSCDPAAGRVNEMFDIEDKPAQGGPDQTLYMNGQKVFKFAAKAMEAAVRKVVDAGGIALDQVKLIVPHQANLRILEFAAKRLGLPLESFQVSIAETGNCSSACVPMALTDAVVSGTLQKGDYAVLVAFGGGFTSGAILLQI